MKLFYLFFLPVITSFNFKKFIGSTIISSSLFVNNVNPVQAYPYIPMANENMQSTKINVDHNNIYFYGSVTTDSCQILKNKINDLNFNSKLYKITYDLEPPPINLHIQSYGGSLMDVLYIFVLFYSLIAVNFSFHHLILEIFHRFHLIIDVLKLNYFLS